MKFVLFVSDKNAEAHPGILNEGKVIDVANLVAPQLTPQLTMVEVIDTFDGLRSQYDEAMKLDGVPIESVRLLPPLPRPGKVLGCIANYWEHSQREVRPLNMFLKNPDAVIGPDETIRLPEMTDPWIFMHEAELGVVLKGPSKLVSQENWKDAVFGYTCFVDVSARGHGRYTWKEGSWLGKSFDTFCPLGPCIATADEIPDPNELIVHFWDDGQLRHNYSTDDMEHRVPELIEFATSVMTLNSGDVIACGTNHEGLGPLQDGETVQIEIVGIGKMELQVEDPLKRSWEKGIYMGEDSTNHEAVRRHRPEETAMLLNSET